MRVKAITKKPRKSGAFFGALGRTKQEALAKREKALADYHNGVLVLDAAKATLAQYLEQWLEEDMREKLAPRTFANYQLQVRRYIIPTSANVKLKDLKPAQSRGCTARCSTLASPPPVCATHTPSCAGH